MLGLLFSKSFLLGYSFTPKSVQKDILKGMPLSYAGFTIHNRSKGRCKKQILKMLTTDQSDSNEVIVTSMRLPRAFHEHLRRKSRELGISMPKVLQYWASWTRGLSSTALIWLSGYSILSAVVAPWHPTNRRM